MVKVGDRVRLLRDDTFGAYKTGDVVKVKSVVDDGIYFEDDDGDERYTYDGAFEPIPPASCKFKVGDRVRVNYSQWEGEATITRLSRYAHVEYDDGRTGAFEFDEIEPVVVAPQPQLRIQAGRYYKTRDGRRVGPMECSDHSWIDIHDHRSAFNSGTSGDFDVNGIWLTSDGTSPHDLIAEWSDDVAVAAPSAVNDNAPKFKVGDGVEHTNLTETGIGVIEDVFDNDTVGVRWSSWHGYCTDPVDDLRLVAEATTAQEAGGRQFTPDDFALHLANEMVETGVCTINEVRNVIGLPPITGGHLLAA